MAINLFDKISREQIDAFIREYSGEKHISEDGISFSSIEKRSFSSKDIASKIDHTILRPDAVSQDIELLCKESMEYNFASVCINPSYVKLCRDMLKGSKVKVCTVIGFPLGSGETSVKRFETEEAINNGADEVDMVINIGRLKDGDTDYVYNDIYEVVNTAKVQNRLIKVIIETCFLTDEEKIKACLISAKAGADFVKTSTGFGKGGAVPEDVALMKYVIGNRMKVKASGGIKNREGAELMLSCGADRLGTSSGVKIMKEFGV